MHGRWKNACCRLDGVDGGTLVMCPFYPECTRPAHLNGHDRAAMAAGAPVTSHRLRRWSGHGPAHATTADPLRVQGHLTPRTTMSGLPSTVIYCVINHNPRTWRSDDQTRRLTVTFPGLSSGQRRLWITQKSMPGGTHQRVSLQKEVLRSARLHNLATPTGYAAGGTKTSPR